MRKPAQATRTRHSLVDENKHLQRTIEQRDMRLVELAADRDERRKIGDQNYENGQQWKAEAAKHEKKNEELRSSINILKEQLHYAEIENARLSGYIERVASDDIAKDPPVRVATHISDDMQPARPHPRVLTERAHRSTDNERPAAMIDDNYRYGTPRRGHWTGL